MKTVKRFDKVSLGKVERTPQGFVRIPAIATRTGVFSYRKADGSVIRELRLPEEVFKPESMASLAGVPVTNDHPPEAQNGGLVDPKNARQLMVGFTGDKVEQRDKFLETVCTITDEKTISDIESGKEMLSCGYRCDLEMVSGEYEGEQYDCIQRDIIYNHLAIVDRGRAGPQVRLRLDSDDAVLYDEPENVPDKKSTRSDNMAKVMIDGKEFEVSDEVKAYCDGLMEKMKAMEGEKEKAKKDAADVQTESQKKLDGMQAKLDQAESENKQLKEKVAVSNNDSADEFNKKYNERRRVEAASNKVLGKFNADASNLEVKKEVIKARHPGVNLDGKSEEYVNARFDALCETLESEGADAVGATVTQNRQDGAKDPVVAAREKAHKEALEAWKQPLSTTKA